MGVENGVGVSMDEGEGCRRCRLEVRMMYLEFARRDELVIQNRVVNTFFSNLYLAIRP